MRYVAFLFLLLLTGCNLARTDDAQLRDAPVIQFQSPNPNVQVVEGTAVDIALIARDEAGSGVARVVLTVDDLSQQQGTPVEAVAVPVFTVEMNWLARGVGQHALSATAFRADGTASNPAYLILEVVAAT